MLKASALYIVIVIALVIGVLCSAIIAAGYYYRSAYQQDFRYDQLKNNLQSGINLIRVSDGLYPTETRLSLFDTGNDTISVKQMSWGLFDVSTIKVFIQQDTLQKAFLLAHNIDSTTWAALYLIDEDRSVSVSGKTHIRGTAFIPKAGIREAYVNNQAYSGDKHIIIGEKKNSNKQLPALLQKRLQNLDKIRQTQVNIANKLIPGDSVIASFFQPTKYLYFKKTPTTLQNITLKGNIVILSDTTITIDSTAHLNTILIFAPEIVVKSGFRGNCQLFADESIAIEPRCSFTYPSCLGVANANLKNTSVKKLDVGDFSTIQGALFIYDAYSSKLPPVLSLGKQVNITGQVFVAGLLNLKDDVRIYGSAFANRFIYQTSYTRYENYLINLDLDAAKLSPYYLTSDLLPVSSPKRNVLQWLK